MSKFLTRRWFLLALLILLPGGLWCGVELGADRLSGFQKAMGPHAATALTALVLFLMSVTLDSGRLRAALARPGPVLWSVCVTYILIPLAAWPLSRMQLTLDFTVGVLIAATVPCTMAAASVWTRKAGGNDAVSLLVTLITNSLCFLVTPLWLELLVPSGGSGGRIEMDTPALMQKLLISALLPISVGQMVRLSRTCAAAADRRKVPLGVVAQCCILLIIAWESVKAGPKIAGDAGTSGGAAAVAVALVSCIVLHIGAMAVAVGGARGLRFSGPDRAAVAFAASQKTLPLGVYVAAAFSTLGAPLAVLPMLMYHVSQLFIDTAVADRLAGSMASAENGGELNHSLRRGDAEEVEA